MWLFTLYQWEDVENILCWPLWCHNELGPGTEYTQWYTEKLYIWTGSIHIKYSLICSCSKWCSSLLSMSSSMLIPACWKWEWSCDIKSSKASSHIVEGGPVNDTTGWLVVLRVKEDGMLETAIDGMWLGRGIFGLGRSSSWSILSCVPVSMEGNRLFWGSAMPYSSNVFLTVHHPTCKNQVIPDVLW